MEKKLAVLAGCALALAAGAREIVLDAKGGGEYPSIQKAVDAAAPGDTITLKGGVYRETVRISKLYEGAPLTLRAAKGERAVVSGFEDVTGWKDEGGGIYSAHVGSLVSDLYVGLVQQQCGRWPEDGTMRPVLTADSGARMFRTDPAKDAPFLAEIAKDPKDAVVFFYNAYGNLFGTMRFDGYDAKTGDISFSEKNWSKWIKPDRNRYSLMNHPALVRNPGGWAFVRDVKDDRKNTAGTLYFRPKSKSDLSNVRYRAAKAPLISVVHWKNPVGNVVIDGIELCGGGDCGIKGRGSDITVKNCLVHNNAGSGISFRGTRNLKVLSNLVLANCNGIGVAETETGLVEGNEIAYGLVDGLLVTGDGSGKKGGPPMTTGVVVRRNYLHHHIMQAHPDNFQMYRGVTNTVIESNFVSWGGQSLMTEDVDVVDFRDNVFMGCSAIMLICGHGNSNQWKIHGNTFWGAGLGFFSFTGQGYDLKRNLLVGGAMSYAATGHDLASDENFFTPAFLVKTAKPWRSYTTPESAAAAVGRDGASKSGVVKFANFPVSLGNGGANGNARDSILISHHKPPADAFLPGDNIELNGDGKMRKVKSWDVGSGVLAFEPALPGVPFRGVLVFNWKDSRSTLIDNTPAKDAPIFENGRQAYGSTISTADFMKGDLLGKGRRTLPVLPPDVAASIPDPNNVVVPPYGH